MKRLADTIVVNHRPMQDILMAPRGSDAPRDWRDDAACRDHDPELFFPEGTAGPALRQAERAKRICQSCPARTLCLRFALRHSLGFGVWGGTTGEERRFMRHSVADPGVEASQPWTSKKDSSLQRPARMRRRSRPAHAAVVRTAIVLTGGLAAILITLQLFGISVTQLLLGGAFATVLLGIAGQQNLSGIFAGLVLLLARPVDIGDRVWVRSGPMGGELRGTVTEISLLYVRLDTPDGLVNLPSQQVLAAAVGLAADDDAKHR